MMGSTMTDDFVAAFRRVLAAGADLANIADIYAWGLERESAALRAVCACGLRGANGLERWNPGRDGRTRRLESTGGGVP